MMLETSCEGFNWAYDAFSLGSRTRCLVFQFRFLVHTLPQTSFTPL